MEILRTLIPTPLRRLRRHLITEAANRREVARVTRLRSLTITKIDYLRALQSALEQRRPYGAGRLGGSEEYWLYYCALMAQGKTQPATALRAQLPYHFHNQTGLFPIDLDFMCQYSELYGQSLRTLDVLGIVCSEWAPHEADVLKHHGLYRTTKVKLVHYIDQEPDRSSPNRNDLCWLPYLRDKRVLLICPFAGLLASRATQATFEAVWQKTGKPWFYPAAVDALEFPYGFETETQTRYGNAINLFTSIAEEMGRRDFDVALVAAAGLGTPIVAEAKRLGKAAIYLGGHLQVLFGVLGKRWREREEWQRLYINEHWIDMPEAYRPKALAERRMVQAADAEPFVLEGADGGSYW